MIRGLTFMKKSLLETLRERRLVCDGAMACTATTCSPARNWANGWAAAGAPEFVRILARGTKIRKIANGLGADCLITNTFALKPLDQLKRHGHVDDLLAINQAGARASQLPKRRSAGAKGFVLGDLGPLGAILEPYRRSSSRRRISRLRRTKRARSLKAAWMRSSLRRRLRWRKWVVAIDALATSGGRAVHHRVVCLLRSFAGQNFLCDDDGRDAGTGAAEFAEERGAHIIALNCGTGMDMNGAAMVAKQYRASCNLPVMVQPNAGLPVLETQQAVYKAASVGNGSGGAECDFSRCEFLSSGSCCGSTPEHTRAIRKVVEEFNRSR